MAIDNYALPREIVCIVGDVRYSGYYVAKDSVVTVDWDCFTKRTQAAASAIETARQLLRELVREHQK